SLVPERLSAPVFQVPQEVVNSTVGSEVGFSVRQSASTSWRLLERNRLSSDDGRAIRCGKSVPRPKSVRKCEGIHVVPVVREQRHRVSHHRRSHERRGKVSVHPRIIVTL